MTSPIHSKFCFSPPFLSWEKLELVLGFSLAFAGNILISQAADALVPHVLGYAKIALVNAESFLFSLSLKQVVWLSGFSSVVVAVAASLLAPALSARLIAWTHFETLASVHAFAASFFHWETTLGEMAYVYAKETDFIPSSLIKTPILHDALQRAIKATDESAFEKILSHLDVESLTGYHTISLLVAGLHKEYFLNRLLATGSIKSFASNYRVLIEALKAGAPFSVISTLLHGRKISDCHDPYRDLPILEAALLKSSTSTDILTLLLEHGADPNHFSRSNALGLAVKSNNIEAVRTLLAHGANKELPLEVNGFYSGFGFVDDLRTYTLSFATCSVEIKNLLFPGHSTPSSSGAASPEPEIRTEKSMLTFTNCAAEVRSNVRLGFFGNEKMDAIVAELHKESPCPYKVLGSTSRDSSDVIYKKFRRLSAISHPEKFPEAKFPKETTTAAKLVFLALNAAKEYLVD